jgi:hypothetical protein
MLKTTENIEKLMQKLDDGTARPTGQPAVAPYRPLTAGTGVSATPGTTPGIITGESSRPMSTRDKMSTWTVAVDAGGGAELLKDNMEVERRRMMAESNPAPHFTNRQSRREIPDILSWIQCVSAVVVSVYPEKMRELLAYQGMIVSEAQERLQFSRAASNVECLTSMAVSGPESNLG